MYREQRANTRLERHPIYTHKRGLGFCERSLAIHRRREDSGLHKAEARLRRLGRYPPECPSTPLATGEP